MCIVTYKRDDKLMESLLKLTQSTIRPAEVYVVDNGRSPDLPGRLASVPLPIELVYPEGNVGCAGLNLAFRRVKAPIVVCLDDDSYPAPECIERLSRVFSSDASIGMISFKMHVPETGEPWHDETWNPDAQEPRDTVYCIGCGLAFRADPRLPEELCLSSIVSQQHELSMVAEFLRLGYSVQFRPECVAYHPQTGGKGTFGPEKFDMCKRNQMIFLGTYLPAPSRHLLVLSYLLFIFLHRVWSASACLAGFLRAPRRPLERDKAALFCSVIMQHTHPRLRPLVAKALGV